MGFRQRLRHVGIGTCTLQVKL